VWYSALRHLTPLRAAIVQLSVPVIAALAGVGLLGEAVRVRLLVSASLILGGIAVAVLSHRAPPAQLAVKPS
jgi:drug/metabolite transporter (DMT)-like permease